MTIYCDVDHVEGKCNNCSNAANIIVYNKNEIKCARCEHVQYSKHSEFYLCELTCENTKYGDWYCNSYQIIRQHHSYSVLRCSCSWKLDCYNCNAYDYVTTDLSCQILSKFLCNYCNNFSRYAFVVEKNAHCNKCNHIVCSKGYEVYLCSTMCNRKKQKYTKYLTTKEDSVVRIEEAYHKKCDNCGGRDKYKCVLICNRNGTKVNLV